MGDLTPYTPAESATVTAIYAWWKKRGDSEKPRNYLGASIIGHECDRYLWYAFRLCYKAAFTGRIYRLFNRGHREEAVFIEELTGIGCEVKAHDESGEQFGVGAVAGHLKGHMDGVALGVHEAPKTWHLCEFKTGNAKNHAKLVSVGVAKAKPVHESQMQLYMGLGGLTRALYLSVNKDTDELYSERLHADPARCKAIVARADRIVKSIQPPERIASRQDDFRCKMCDAYAICWGTGAGAVPLPAKTCRTCCHATPEMDGDARWSCRKGVGSMTFAEQLLGCPKHLLLPGLVLFAEPMDGGEDWIEFKNASDGAVWRHGAEAGAWSTEELMSTPGPVIGKKAVEIAKKVFGGKVVEVECGQLWEGLAEDWPAVEKALKAALGLKEGDALPDPTGHVEDDDHDVYQYGDDVVALVYKTGAAKVVDKSLPF